MKRKARQQAAIRKLPEQAPLLAKLQALSKEVDKRFRDVLRGFDNIGLGLGTSVPNERATYYCTPLNSKGFASTGGEGVHFSFLAERQDRLFDELPVIVTIPMAVGNQNFVVGENLREFLSLGAYRGYFALEQLGDSLEKTLEVYASPQWQAETHEEFWVGFGVNELQQSILQLLRQEFQLHQWPDLKARFFQLQEKYMPLVRLPESV